MTLHNISHCIYQDVAQISPSLFLTIFLIKDIQLGVAGQISLANQVTYNYHSYTIKANVSDAAGNAAAEVTSSQFTICGNYFTQHIPLHIPRRSLNKPKPIPDYLPD